MRTGKKSTSPINGGTKFPVEVRRGSVVVKVYLTPSKGREPREGVHVPPGTHVGAATFPHRSTAAIGN